MHTVALRTLPTLSSIKCWNLLIWTWCALNILELNRSHNIRKYNCYNNNNNHNKNGIYYYTTQWRQQWQQQLQRQQQRQRIHITFNSYISDDDPIGIARLYCAFYGASVTNTTSSSTYFKSEKESSARDISLSLFFSCCLPFFLAFRICIILQNANLNSSQFHILARLCNILKRKS